MTKDLQVLILAQPGRLDAAAELCAASCRAPHSWGVTVAGPRPSAIWPNNQELSPEGLTALVSLGARIIRFAPQYFGRSYPNGNRIEALFTLRPDQPFIAFDTDTLILGDLCAAELDSAAPGASERVEPTWPRGGQGRSGRKAVWRSLYHRFGLAEPSSFGYFCASRVHGPCPHRFATHWLSKALALRDSPPAALTGQALFPWLDQIALPLTLAALQGGQDAPRSRLLDDGLSYHYRSLALAHARAPRAALTHLDQVTQDPILAGLLARYAPFRKMLTPTGVARVRRLFKDHPHADREKPYRKRLKAAGLWDR